MSHTNPNRHAVLAAAAGLIVGLAACDRNAPAVNAKDPVNPPPSVPRTDIDATNSALVAAAERFKSLALAAFLAERPAIDASVLDCALAVREVRASLPPPVAAEIDATVARLQMARDMDDRAGVALAAAEGYRAMMSAEQGPLKIPVEVRLIDYAALRYLADLKANPPRWDDMLMATAIALDHWKLVRARAAASPAQLMVDQLLAAMTKAAHEHDPMAAADAVGKLRDQVVQLEAFFGMQGGGR